MRGLRNLLLTLACVSKLAAASEIAVSVGVGGEAYQAALIAEARLSRALRPEPTPSGKTIERIVIASNGVILPTDPWPEFLNWFHFTTRSSYVRRELLFTEGDRWDPEVIAENARNLRKNLFVAVAEIVPCEGSAPDRVIALIVTKDLWSLRLNTAFSFIGGRLEVFEAQLAEFNLLGRNHMAGVNFHRDLAAISGGGEYRDPRVFGTHVAAAAKADLILERLRGGVEGEAMAFSLGQPLYSLDTPWAWSASVDYRRDVFRLFSAGDILRVTSKATGESVPYEIRRRVLEPKVKATRSFGRDWKHDFTAGWKASLREYALPLPRVALQPASLAEFSSRYLPRSENAGILFLHYRTYFTEFRPYLDVETFALTEDYRLGPDLTLETRAANPAFGFSTSFFEPLATLDYVWAYGDNILTAGASAVARYQPEAGADSPWVNRQVTLRIHNASPPLGPVRFHAAARLLRRGFDLNRQFETLGGDRQLRGYPSGYLSGSQLWSTNLEVRTLPIAAHTLHLGGAAFLDFGDAFDAPSSAGVHAAAGVGLRVLFPQFNRVVLRGDLGFPLETLRGASPDYLVIQFGQAFD